MAHGIGKLLDEYARLEITLPGSIPRPVTTPSGRPSMTMVEMTELVLDDTRMGSVSLRR